MTANHRMTHVNEKSASRGAYIRTFSEIFSTMMPRGRASRMAMIQLSKLYFIWSIADLINDTFKRE